MLIELNRFLTKGQIRQLYRIPADVLPGVMANVPVVHREGGEQYFVESDVDRAVDEYAASAAGSRRPACDPAPKGRPGRRTSTADIAMLANELKKQGNTWKEIYAACKSQFPGRVDNVEQVRTSSRFGRSGGGTSAARSRRSRKVGRLIPPNFSPSMQAGIMAKRGRESGSRRVS